MQTNADQRERRTRNITLWGVAVNILLAIVKTVGGVIGHSAALLADGIHSISDLVSDVMVLYAARHASGEADEDHPYGHERFETLATVALGGLLVIVGVGIAWDGVSRLLADSSPVVPHVYTLYIAAASIISKELLYHLTRRVALDIRSKMLEANAWHHRSDAVSSIVVLIGIAGAHLGYPLLDAYAAIIVAVMVIKIGVELAYDSITELVDTALDADRVEEIKAAILSIEDVRELHMLRSRRMGHNALVDVHLQVAPRLSVSEGHQVSEAVERLLIERFEEINDVTVHVDPEDDESEARCSGLPLRSELLRSLQQEWAEVPGLDQVEDVTLHYLGGKVTVEARLPLDGLSDLDSARVLQQQFEQASKHIDCISKTRLQFG